jgi:hypothetical protein
MPSNWLVFDRIRAMTRQNRIFRSERVFQDQSQIDRLTAGGEFLDFSAQAAILDQTNLQINRLERYKDYEQMDQMGEISLALDLYADEASLIDPERKHTLVIRAKNRRLKKELEDLFYNNLRWDTQCRPCIRYLCKYGDMPFEIILDANRGSVSSLRFMNVYNFTRIETRYGDLVGFFFMDTMWPKPLFMHPWQVMHLRLTNFENLYAPYGKSILDGGRKAFKQLRLMEDAALIYRITRAPEKRKFTIPVGMIPPKEVPEYMQMIARNFKRQRFYNPATGTFDERYSPLIQEDDFFLPRRPDGTGPDVDVLPGAENLDQIADIEYFKKKMIAPMKIPFSRVGIGEGAGEASEKSLSQSHSEFSKAVQWIQREVATGLTKVAIVHLALRGFDIDDLKGFEIALTATSAMEELYRIETWQTRTGVMADLKDLGWFPKEWIVTHFTDLSPDEIEELKDLEDDANTPSGGGGGGGGGMADLGSPDEGGADDLMAGIDLPTGEEAGGAEAAPAAEAGGEAGGEAGAEGGAEGLKEARIKGYDYSAEKRLLSEAAKAGKKRKMKKLLDEWSQKTNGITNDLSSCFNHILESKELDGLSRDFTRGDTAVRNPLFAVSISDAEREAAIKETIEVLTKDES